MQRDDIRFAQERIEIVDARGPCSGDLGITRAGREHPNAHRETVSGDLRDLPTHRAESDHAQRASPEFDAKFIAELIAICPSVLTHRPIGFDQASRVSKHACSNWSMPLPVAPDTVITVTPLT